MLFRSATQFRIWANKVLKEYLVKGYSINEKRLREHSCQLDDLKQTVKLLGNVIESKTLDSDEAAGLLKVITDYTYALDLLDKYDHQALEIQSTTVQELFRITYSEAVNAIRELKNKLGGSWLFGNEKDESFQSSLAAIYHTFDNNDLYPSVEEKAANLLYLVVKNHSFSDGNKRIAAFLFIWFLETNGILYKPYQLQQLRILYTKFNMNRSALTRCRLHIDPAFQITDPAFDITPTYAARPLNH